MENDKVVVLMHSPNCPKAASFAPTLDAIAESLPNLAYGRVDVSQPGFQQWRIEEGEPPSLRAFFRNAPPQYRILEYGGPPTRDPAEAWCRGISDWDGSAKPPEGFSDGRDGDATAAGKDGV